ncbi:winged helix-turn-helix domain-containing tetratricopeptide repeat protein [Mesorhizobium calcicola]|uniref:Winged helix-turn-helix domain-containing tetratricopeptide repeat protein n=1 Tax=Mesorhizobium calcicola TaxID=1300310 RepID=A0ABW4WPD7_9HYPH
MNRLSSSARSNSTRLLDCCGGTDKLLPRGIALLDTLLAAGGQTVSKDELLAKAWPGVIVEEANLSVQMATLRKALGPAPNGEEWVVTVPRLGYRLPRAIARSSPLRPSIAVLPFQSHPGDGEDEYFADGMVEDIITALSRFRTFAVVARNAAFAYKGRSPDSREVARALGVRYVLEGSVRRRDSRLRVSVQLVDAAEATQLWADQFDGEVAHLFDFQDRITEAVVGLVEPEVRKAEIHRARRKPPDSLDAYDLYLRALPLFRGASPEVNAEAIRLLESAVELDSTFAIALAYAGWAYERKETFGRGLSSEERRRALELAERAVDAGGDDPLVAAISALVFMSVGRDGQRSLVMLRQALAGNPNNSTVLSLCAFCNVMLGDLAFGRECYLHALQIAPGALDNYEILLGIGLSHLVSGEFEQALEWAQRSLAATGNGSAPTGR